MKLVEQTAATDIPVSITTAAEHLRVVDVDEYTLIERLIKSATKRLQQRHWTQFCTATFDEYFDSFGNAPFLLRRNPIGTVSSVKYTDLDGTEQTVSTDTWEQGLEDGRGIIRLKYDQTWPTDCRGHTDDVVIRYTAGYGAQADVPEPIVDAVLVEIADRYLLRESIVPDRMKMIERLTDNLMAGYSYRTTGRR
jgi:uncharacterized phiE125 gp8 family phage protein